jgi:hypothetical protein
MGTSQNHKSLTYNHRTVAMSFEKKQQPASINCKHARGDLWDEIILDFLYPSLQRIS